MSLQCAVKRATVTGETTHRMDGFMDWLLIETVPKDGSLILLANNINDEYAVADCYFEGCLLDANQFVTSDGSVFRATHWMPIPEPPQSLSASDSADSL